jgi:hypothetical protein
MSKQDTPAPDIDQPNLVRPYVEGEDLKGRMMCYRCYYSFPAPIDKLMAQDVKCPNCKTVDAYYQHKCHESDPNRHSAGWPYDDPTVPYDC